MFKRVLFMLLWLSVFFVFGPRSHENRKWGVLLYSYSQIFAMGMECWGVNKENAEEEEHWRWVVAYWMCVCRCYICGQPPSAWCVRRTTAAWRWVRVTTLYSAARARSHRKTAPTVRRPSSRTLSLTANRRKLLHHH